MARQTAAAGCRRYSAGGFESRTHGLAIRSPPMQIASPADRPSETQESDVEKEEGVHQRRIWVTLWGDRKAGEEGVDVYVHGYTPLLELSLLDARELHKQLGIALAVTPDMIWADIDAKAAPR
jgi:hypothetical protein